MPSMTHVPRPLPSSLASTADVARSASPTRAVDDHGLLHRVAAHDPHAFEQLYQRYARRLRGYLQRRLPPQVLPEDVLHEILLLVWHQPPRCAPNTPLGAWLFGIARRKASEARRAARLRPAPPPAAVASEAEMLEGGVAQHELARAVRHAVASLPPAERQVVELTYYHDWSYPEIATLVACPVNTVKARMARARRRLAPQLGALGVAPAPDLAALPPCQAHGAPVRARPPRRPDL